VAAEAAAVPRAVRQVVAERLAAVVCRTWAHPEAAPRTKASSEVQAAAVVEPRAQLALLAAQRAVRPVVRKACRAVLQVGPQVARPALVECRVEVPRAVMVPQAGPAPWVAALQEELAAFRRPGAEPLAARKVAQVLARGA